jgi:hypothetical protein
VALAAPTKEGWLRVTIPRADACVERGTLIPHVAGCKIAEELERSNLLGLLQQLGVLRRERDGPAHHR